MKHDSSNWTREELCAYIFIYAMNADFIEDQSEISYTLEQVTESTYDKMHAEYKNDNDFQSVEKISENIDRLEYSNEEIEELLIDIKELFKIDGQVDIQEKILFNGLRKILKK